MTKPYYEQNGITIYHGDCRDVLPTLDTVDAVITDPPYGIDWNTNSKRFSGGQRKIGRGDGRSDWLPIREDNNPFDPTILLGFPRIVLWGANHYAQLLPHGTWLTWIKKADHLFGTFLSDCELAWMKGGYGVYAYRKQFPPPCRMKEGGGAVLHPTQKPVGLMAWCIKRSSCPEGGTVLDPFMGSGTTLVAAKQLGRRAIGIEIEEKYCEIAAKRLAQAVLPLEVSA